MRESKRMKKGLKGILLIIIIFVFLLTGVVSASQWAIKYGEAHYQRDTGSSIEQTTDNGYIVAGTTQYFSADSDDIWILKLNPEGAITWQKTYGSVDQDEVSSILQTADGGYVVLGDAVFFGSYDFWVLKLNSDGTIAWQKTYGSSNTEYASSIQQTLDGGYIVVGNMFLGINSGVANYDILVLKLNPDGTISWQKTYGGSYFDFAYSILQTSDGGYILVGNTTSYGTGNPEVEDVWVLKLDTNGNVLWQKTYGGNGYDSVLGDSIKQTTDGGYIVAGQTNSFGAGSWDFWVFKLDTNGNVLWQKTYGSSIYEGARAIQQTSDGGYIVVGGTGSPAGYDYEGILILKLNTDGAVSWQKTYDNVGRTCIRSIQETSDGGYVLAGWNQACPFCSDSVDLLIMKLDANGELPGCNIMDSFDANVTNTSAIITNTGVGPQEFSVVPSDTNVIPQDTEATTDVICGVSPIGCSPTSFSFTATQGGSNPSNQSLSISNTDGGTLNWSVSDNATWLSLDPISGTNSGTVTLSVNTVGLTAGTYNATIIITADYPVESIPVTLTVNAPPNSITLIAPNGNEVVPSGSTYTIRWIAPPEAVKFTLRYSINNGSKWKLIAKNITGTSYDWMVPIQKNNKKNCLVKVIGFNASGIKVGEDISDSTFTIEVVKLTSPDGGEILTSGSTYAITWTTHATKNPVAKVKLSYTVTGGITWGPIKTLTGNPNGYNWTLPLVVTAPTQCKVKVVLKDSGGVTVGSDISDGLFTIQP